MQIVIQSLLALGIKLLTSSVIEKVVLLGLRELAKKTDNEVDDELVRIVEEAIKKPPQEIPERASR
jgi:hypothetical protein